MSMDPDVFYMKAADKIRIMVGHAPNLAVTFLEGWETYDGDVLVNVISR